jgi:hypothetical protein
MKIKILLYNSNTFMFRIHIYIIYIQRGQKKCTHSLSAAITPDTLTAVFAQQFGGIDAV